MSSFYEISHVNAHANAHTGSYYVSLNPNSIGSKIAVISPQPRDLSQYGWGFRWRSGGASCNATQRSKRNQQRQPQHTNNSLPFPANQRNYNISATTHTKKQDDLRSPLPQQHLLPQHRSLPRHTCRSLRHPTPIPIPCGTSKFQPTLSPIHAFLYCFSHSPLLPLCEV